MDRLRFARSMVARLSCLGFANPRTPNRVRRVALGVSLILAGCGHAPSSPTATLANVFRVPLPISFSSIDPALASETYSIETMQNTFEGLVVMDTDNRVHPCLAESWDISKDGKTYTFHLRPGVKFHNGRIFEAADVKRSIERACSKELNAPLASDYLNDIAGMRSFHLGQSPGITGIRVLNPSTVAFTLDAPRPYFLLKLTCPVASVADCSAIKDGVHIGSVAEMVGTGPFRFESYVEGQRLTQRTFDGFWGGRPSIDGVEHPVMPDSVTRLNAFKRGEVDMVDQITRSDYSTLSQDPKYKNQLQLIDRATLAYLALNVKDWPDRRVRAAIAKSIDRDVIASDTLFGTVDPARGLLPPSIPGYRANPNWLGPDVAGAKKLLAESGHPGGAGLPELRISFAIENPDIERIADQIGAQIHTKLGISVRLDRMDTGTLIAKQNRRELQCVMSGWFADYLDPQDFLSMLLTTGSPENHWGYSNPTYDRLCAEADVCLDPNKRMKLYAQAEDIVLQDAVMIPISYWKVPSLIGSRVHGVRADAGQFLSFAKVSLGPRR